MRADFPVPDAYPRKTFSLPRDCWRSSAARRLRNSSGLGRRSLLSLTGIPIDYHRRQAPSGPRRGWRPRPRRSQERRHADPAVSFPDVVAALEVDLILGHETLGRPLARREDARLSLRLRWTTTSRTSLSKGAMPVLSSQRPKIRARCTSQAQLACHRSMLRGTRRWPGVYLPWLGASLGDRPQSPALRHLHPLVRLRQRLAPSARLARVVPMKSVKDAVDHRRENDTRDDEDDHAGVQRIEASEELPTRRYWRLDRPHATKEHRRVEKGVQPAEPFEIHVASHTYDQRAHEDQRRHPDVFREPLQEPLPGRRRSFRRSYIEFPSSSP